MYVGTNEQRNCEKGCRASIRRTRSIKCDLLQSTDCRGFGTTLNELALRPKTMLRVVRRQRSNELRVRASARTQCPRGRATGILDTKNGADGIAGVVEDSADQTRDEHVRAIVHHEIQRVGNREEVLLRD